MLLLVLHGNFIKTSYKNDEIFSTIPTKYLTYINFVYMNFYYISAPVPSKRDDNCFLQFQNQTPVKGISCLYALQCCCPHQKNVNTHTLFW